MSRFLTSHWKRYDASLNDDVDGGVMQKLLEMLRELIYAVTEAAHFFRQQNYARAWGLAGAVANLGEACLEAAAEQGFDVGAAAVVFKSMLDAMERRDEEELADIYGSDLSSVLFEMQALAAEAAGYEPPDFYERNMRLLKDADPDLCTLLKSAPDGFGDEYMLGWAATGDNFLSIETKKFGHVSLSSRVNPWEEAMTYADMGAAKSCDEIVVVGVGMGYHLNALARKYEYKKITALENDISQLKICMTYANMKYALSHRDLKIRVPKNRADYMKYMARPDGSLKKGVMIWRPSVKCVKDASLREWLEDVFLQCNAVENDADMLDGNIRRNILLNDPNADDLAGDLGGADVVFVAGGPSVDENMADLKKISEKGEKKIICAGKIAAKLFNAGVKIDYIVIADAKASTAWQLRGLRDCGVPLIYISTAAANVVSEYGGRRHIAFQEGVDLAEKAAREGKKTLYESGGSVATFAIDLFIRMKCRRVICVGLDMGYKGDATHALGIGHKIEDKKPLRKVAAVGGGFIYANGALDMYRTWIERRIRGERDVEFINASFGAKIAGMKDEHMKDFV